MRTFLISDGKDSHSPGWESIDNHKELIASPIYKDLIGALSSCIDLTQPRTDIVHFSFDTKLEDIISAPDTEFTLLKLKEGKSAEEFLKLYSETLQPLLKPNPAKGLVAAGDIGSGIEQPGLYLIPLGWESKEVGDTLAMPFTRRRLNRSLETPNRGIGRGSSGQIHWIGRSGGLGLLCGRQAYKGLRICVKVIEMYSNLYCSSSVLMIMLRHL